MLLLPVPKTHWGIGVLVGLIFGHRQEVFHVLHQFQCCSQIVFGLKSKLQYFQNNIIAYEFMNVYQNLKRLSILYVTYVTITYPQTLVDTIYIDIYTQMIPNAWWSPLCTYAHLVPLLAMWLCPNRSLPSHVSTHPPRRPALLWRCWGRRRA